MQRMQREKTERERAILDMVTRAIDDFNTNEVYLIKNDLSERCICSKFASYIEKALIGTEFCDYKVDVEYNRGYEGVDSRAKIVDDKKIVVDLIVHKREYSELYGYDNLICVEMKKSYARRSVESDKERLRKMVDVSRGYQYAAGYMILIDSDKKHNQYGLRIESEYYRHY